MRTSEIVVQELHNDLLIYDISTHQAYTLNETSAKVFKACDGKTSFDELKRKYKFTDDLIYLALDELKANNLIEDYTVGYFAGMSRREVIKKVGLATMIALPAIAIITIPQSVHAQSCVPLEADCTSGTCCSGNVCVNGGGGPTCRIPSGGPCSLNDPGQCASLTCVNGTPTPTCL